MLGEKKLNYFRDKSFILQKKGKQCLRSKSSMKIPDWYLEVHALAFFPQLTVKSSEIRITFTLQYIFQKNFLNLFFNG